MSTPTTTVADVFSPAITYHGQNPSTLILEVVAEKAATANPIREVPFVHQARLYRPRKVQTPDDFGWEAKRWDARNPPEERLDQLNAQFNPALWPIRMNDLEKPTRFPDKRWVPILWELLARTATASPRTWHPMFPYPPHVEVALGRPPLTLYDDVIRAARSTCPALTGRRKPHRGGHQQDLIDHQILLEWALDLVPDGPIIGYVDPYSKHGTLTDQEMVDVVEGLWDTVPRAWVCVRKRTADSARYLRVAWQVAFGPDAARGLPATLAAVQ